MQSIKFAKTHLFLVMEFIENDMKNMMNNVSLVELQEEHIVTIMYNALCSLKFVHSCNIIHRDLKPANFLIDLKCGVKICDFGLARTMPKKDKFWSEFKELRKAFLHEEDIEKPRTNRFKEKVADHLISNIQDNSTT